MEASTLHPAASLARPRVGVGGPLLRFRSDEQLVELFRAGSEEAFRVIHDRYQKRLFAYARQMLPARQDAEDALQDVFVRAYSGLRSSDRELALRAWLFRIAHNRCIDELRKPSPPPPEVLQLVRSTVHDPLVEVDLRESLRRLVEDIRRLPEQQRSALLMRELGGMSYVELSASLGISVGAVKSLLVRARLALAEASEARDTACSVIREQLIEAHDRGLRPNATARKHMRDCVGCKSFRRELRGVSRQLAATAPTLGPLGFLTKLLGFSGGAGGGAAGGAGGSAALFGGSGATASAGGLALGANHVATLIVAAVATAGGAVEIQRTFLHQSHSATVRDGRIARAYPSDERVLPRGAALDLDTRGIAGTASAIPHARAKAAVGGTKAPAKATSRHTSHVPTVVRLDKDNAKRSVGTVSNKNDLPSAPIIPSSSTTTANTTTTTTATPAPTSTQVTASCPATVTPAVSGDQSSNSGNAPTGSTQSGSAAPSSGTTPTPPPTSASCGASTGSTAASAPAAGGSTTADSTTTSPTTNSTSNGSGSAAAATAGSSPGASTSSSVSGTTTG